MWNVDEMLAGMSSHLLTEWIAYNRLETFGGELLDIHLAKFQALMASSNGDVKDPEKFRVWRDTKPPFDPQEYFESLKSVITKGST